MKSSMYVGVVATLFLVFVGAPASSNELNLNCSGDGACEGDEAPCPPDSLPELGPDGGPCVCSPKHCIQPNCRFGSHLVLQRIGSTKPGDCCNIYECVTPKEKNCSEVVCPEETVVCPEDSYRLPSRKAPDDCCSVSQGCQCVPSACPPGTCADGERLRVVRPGTGKPGACCPIIECQPRDSINDTCLVDDQVKQNGSTWWKNNCTSCRCTNGLIFCSISPPCPELDKSCTVTRVPSNECCPVCDVFPSDSCVSGMGKIFANNETWQEDPCTSCTCVEGTKKCQAYMCETCPNGVYVPGQCCPVCNGSSIITLPPHCPLFNNCSLRCMHGFKQDEEGCFYCQCQAEQCLLDCPDGYSQDARGNKLCACAGVTTVSPPTPAADCPPLTGCRKTCPHGFKLNKAGCEVCKCSQCRPLADCDKNCPHGFKTNDRACPICKCRAAVDQTKQEDNPVLGHNDTDLACTTSDGQTRGDGEAWFDGCRHCYCHGTSEMCNLITCPLVKCKDPTYHLATDCCPRCPGIAEETSSQTAMLCQSVDGMYRVEGETWQLNNCTQCLCHAGRVLCEAKRCQPTPCLSPITIPGQCCPQCPHTEVVESGASCGMGHPHGSFWREGKCRSCTCDSGRVRCFDLECAVSECDHPVLIKDQCCPICLDHSTPKICEVGNQTYHADETWDEDACTHCVCLDGTKSCTEKVCSVSCPSPVKKPGKCCPVCKPESSSSLGLFMETTYLAVICVLFCVSACLVLYVGRRECRRRRQMVLGDAPSSTHSYNNYSTHTPPPHYTSADRRDPYQYKFVQSYDTTHIDDLLKSPEKMALAPV